MQITIDTDSPKDVQLLTALANVISGGSAPAPAPAAKAAVAPKKAMADTVPEPKPEPAPEPVAAPEPEAAAAPEAGGEDLLEQAVALATELVADGKAQDVKKQLEAHGAARVSKLDPAKLPDFIAALSAL